MILIIFSCVYFSLSSVNLWWTVQILCPFFNWVVSLLLSLRALYILDINPLPDMRSMNICSQSVIYFHFLNITSQKAEIFNFEEVQFIIFFFMDHAISVITKKSLLNLKSQRFYSRNFIVWGFVFRALIHFKLIFIYGLRFIFCI